MTESAASLPNRKVYFVQISTLVLTALIPFITVTILWFVQPNRLGGTLGEDLLMTFGQAFYWLIATILSFPGVIFFALSIALFILLIVKRKLLFIVLIPLAYSLWFMGDMFYYYLINYQGF